MKTSLNPHTAPLSPGLRTLAVAVAALASGAPALSVAQQTQPGSMPTVGGVLYRFQGSDGKVFYTDRIPPGFKGSVDYLSAKSGTLQKQEERQLSESEFQAKESERAAADAKAKTSAAQMRQDQSLLNQYGSVAEIDSMKKLETAQIDRAIQMDQSNLATLRDRMDLIDKEIMRDERNKSVYRDEISRIQDNMRRIQDNMRLNQQTMSERVAKYDSDKVRYQNLLDAMGASKK